MNPASNYEVVVKDLLAEDLPHKEPKIDHRQVKVMQFQDERQKMQAEAEINQQLQEANAGQNLPAQNQPAPVAQPVQTAQPIEEPENVATPEMTAKMITGGVISITNTGKLLINNKIEEFFTDEEWLDLREAQQKEKEDLSEREKWLIVQNEKLNRKINRFENTYGMNKDDEERLEAALTLAARQNGWKASSNAVVGVEIFRILLEQFVAIKTF